MEKMRHMRHSALFSEINITPLTDIFLVLMIIMMVVAPILTQTRQDIVPPRISGGEELGKEGLSMEVAADGRWFIDGTEVSESGLGTVLSARQPSLAKKELVVRADKRVRSDSMFDIFKAAEAAGFDRVLVTGEANQPMGSKPEARP